MRETNFVFRKYNGYGCLECNGDFLVFLQYIVGIGEYFFTVINRQGPTSDMTSRTIWMSKVNLATFCHKKVVPWNHSNRKFASNDYSGS